MKNDFNLILLYITKKMPSFCHGVYNFRDHCISASMSRKSQKSPCETFVMGKNVVSVSSYIAQAKSDTT